MESLWNKHDANAYQGDAVGLRVYSSRLIGQDPNLVLHGGGNTSVKAPFVDIFGDTHEAIYIKGSGWDLATIEAAAIGSEICVIARRATRTWGERVQERKDRA